MNDWVFCLGVNFGRVRVFYAADITREFNDR